ncbi:DUF2254 domain-containing protein [Virgibacillus sp. CBA3643]|uniref:DUF2254 domain-containing protein n=1 Tax=Virgibacillus sp. CBA3643 TaxID=2942278 RepID=UPI0035A31D5B
MNQATFWFRVRDSLWFLPLLYGICSIIAVSVITALDDWLVPQISDSIPNIFLTGQSVATEIYGSLITATLTMTTITFSTIMVVLTTYSSQFSPRALQDFMRSKITQHVLGVFTFGFIFVLINLWLLSENDQKELLSPFFTILIAITSLGFFILFIHYAAHWVQVNFLIGTIRNDTSKIIREAFEERTYGEHQHWDHSQIENIRKKDRQTIYAKRSGYIQKVDYNYLINWTTTNNLVLEANFQVGDYVPKGMPVFYFWAFSDIKDDVTHDKFLTIGDERTDIQDIEFSMEKLVEIAVKALSTSINDPNTAINSINRIGGLLSELAGNYRPVTYYSDDDGQLRLIMEQKSFLDYLYTSFYQIKHYGKDDISVVYSIVEALYKLAIVSDNDSLTKEIWNFNNYILESVEVSELSSMDYEHLKGIMEKFADFCGEELNW